MCERQVVRDELQSTEDLFDLETPVESLKGDKRLYFYTLRVVLLIERVVLVLSMMIFKHGISWFSFFKSLYWVLFFEDYLESLPWASGFT